MAENINCRLCAEKALHYCFFRNIDYFRCDKCRSVMMDPHKYLSFSDEKKRYDQHNNDINDPGYQQFVKPLVDKVQLNHDPDARGLDYGAGPGPVASVLLKEKGYKLELYDPFYHPDQRVLKKQYDFIICCEVIEHFHFPYDQFKQLSLLLKQGGSLYCMTELYSEEINFEQWYYKNDPTHVFFYHRLALEWLRDSLRFSDLFIDGKLIHFAS